MPGIVAYEVTTDDSKGIAKQFLDLGIDVKEISSNGFDGTALVTLLIDLTNISASIIAGLYVATLRSKRYAKLRINGVEVSGVTEKTVLKVLENAVSHSATRSNSRKTSEKVSTKKKSPRRR